MTFSQDIERFKAKLERRAVAVVDGTIEAVHGSMVEGSPITGAPGLPEDLRDKYPIERRGPMNAVIACDDPSARSVEEGISVRDGSPITLKSDVGGFHGNALTRVGFQPLVDDVVRRLGDA